jgi:hypothetical protein
MFEKSTFSCGPDVKKMSGEAKKSYIFCAFRL